MPILVCMCLCEKNVFSNLFHDRIYGCQHHSHISHDLLKQNKSRSFGYMHLKDIIKRAIKFKNITPVVYPECVRKVGDSGHFSG